MKTIEPPDQLIQWIKSLSLANWDEFAGAVQGFTTSAALFVGGVWAYFRFVKNRLLHPKAKIEHKILHQKLTLEKTLLHVVVHLSNTGDVLLPVEYLWTRIGRMIPITGEELIGLEDKRGEDGSQEDIDWPEIECIQITYEKGKSYIEPGESERFTFDYLIPSDLKVVSIYSFFQNSKREDTEVGWSLRTIYNLERELSNGDETSATKIAAKQAFTKAQ